MVLKVLDNLIKSLVNPFQQAVSGLTDWPMGILSIVLYHNRSNFWAILFLFGSFGVCVSSEGVTSILTLLTCLCTIDSFFTLTNKKKKQIAGHLLKIYNFFINTFFLFD